ncbi:ABC transporter permease [Hyalangium versicolor]|uniref:ABC transporter permease n=1 Tax=Hyalangium versicolor TaxID=2861190 RepID=UPI001CCF8EB4|nr:ABC transporter permease [Hyalangium versicolor]
MLLALLRLVSLRHLVQAPLRTALTLVGVAVGVATMVGVAAINRSVMDAFRSTVDTVAGKADLTVAGSQVGFSEEVLAQVRSVPGVAHASGNLAVIAPVQGSPGESLYVMGVDLLDDGYFRTYEGVDRNLGSLTEDLEFLNSTDRMLVSERFAREHGLKVGDTFTLMTSSGAQDFIVHALVRESGPIKAFGGSVAVMDVASAQAAFGRDRKLDRIDVAVDPKVGVDATQENLRRALGGAFEVEPPSRRGGSVEAMVSSFQMGLNLGSGVALLVGVFLVYNTISISVVQRRREIGTLRALGASRLRIRALFTLEAMLLGGVGTAVGLPLGVLVGRAAIGVISQTISTLYVKVNARDIQVTVLELGLGVALGVLGSAFAALRPALHASRVQPVEALRRDAAAGLQVGDARPWTLWAGLGCLAVVYPLTQLPSPMENMPVGGYLAVFLVLMGTTLLAPTVLEGLGRVYRFPGERLLGISGRLAADNFSRAPGRTAVPVSALTIGVSMAVCISGFVNSFVESSDRWIQQSVPADLFVISSARTAGLKNQPMRPELGTAIIALPGVAQVDRVRILPHEVLGIRIYVISLDPEVYVQRTKPLFLEGRMSTPEEWAAGRVLISENFSRRRDLHVGDSIEMSTPTGVRTYTVGAVVVDYTSNQGGLVMAREVYKAHFQDDRVDIFETYLSDPGRLEEVRRAITEKWGRSYDLYVMSNSELRQEISTLMDDAFRVTYAMEGVAVLLALLGVINTLLAAVLDRTREIGLLRAVGAARGHVLRLFVGEAAFIGLSGGLLGVLAGAVLGLIVTTTVGEQATGWRVPYHFPTAVALQMSLTSTLCAAVAGLYPARRAAALDVVEALAYE